MAYAGEWAALLTAVCWTISSVAFTAAGDRVGSIPVNVVCLSLAVLMFAVFGLIASGSPLPFHAPAAGWGWMTVSGLVGFFFGDLCLFKAFILIGPRISLLFMSLAPPLTAALAVVFLGERLSTLQIVAVLVTVAGIATAVSERATDGAARRRFTWKGGALAFGGALGQALGSIAAKKGLVYLDSPVEATAIRALAGLAGFATLAAIRSEGPRIMAALRDRRAFSQITLGAAAGPVAGVSLLMFALSRIPAGLAQTFAATAPVMILPVSHWLHRERVSPRALAGALIAFAGVAMLFRV